MIENIEKTGIHLELDSDIKRYIDKKIGRLDRYIPRHARQSAHAEVKLKETGKPTDKYSCEVILHLPGGQVTAKESTLNVFAAVDIVEAKLKNQLKKYKDIHNEHRGRHGILSRLKRRFARSSAVEQSIDS